MLLSKHTFITIVPRNHAYWKTQGYNVGRTGGRAGANGVRRIKVKTEDLEPGSGVHVACRCDECGKKFVQRFHRDKEFCGECRQAAGRKKPRTLSIDPKMPFREELLQFIEGGRGGKTAAAKHYGISTMVIKGWLKKHEIEFAESLKHKTIPADFVEYIQKNNPTKMELAGRYDTNLALIDRWFKRLNLSFKGVTSRIEMASIEEMSMLNQNLDTDELAERYGVSASIIRKWFRRNNVQLKQFDHGTSDEEKELVDFLNEVKPGFVQNRKSVLVNKRMELDAYHPELRIAFEYDGAFWHSLSIRSSHRKKWDYCNELGIRLYRIHSFEWKYKKDLVKSMILARLGVCNQKVFARKLDVRKIERSTADRFHEANHVSGFGNSSVNFGLYDDDEQLMSVMSFVKSKYPGNYEWEISRFSTQMNCLIVGGASKLFSTFKKIYEPRSVLTFADLRWGSGKVYENLGFKRIKRGDPTYWFYHEDFPTKRFSRQAFTKNKLSKKLHIFNPVLSEEENMSINKYWKYWDCGSDHFVWEK